MTFSSKNSEFDGIRIEKVKEKMERLARNDGRQVTAAAKT
jgi:hypothetical protein